MPIVRIESLPLARDTDIARVLEGVCKEFAEAVAVNVDDVCLTWRYFSPGHYVNGGRAAGLQEDHSHPVLVTILAPDCFSQTRIELMLKTIAECICRRTHVPFENILASFIPLQKGRVLDKGNIVNWADQQSET